MSFNNFIPIKLSTRNKSNCFSSQPKLFRSSSFLLNTNDSSLLNINNENTPKKLNLTNYNSRNNNNFNFSLTNEKLNNILDYEKKFKDQNFQIETLNKNYLSIVEKLTNSSNLYDELLKKFQKIEIENQTLFNNNNKLKKEIELKEIFIEELKNKNQNLMKNNDEIFILKNNNEKINFLNSQLKNEKEKIEFDLNNLQNEVFNLQKINNKIENNETQLKNEFNNLNNLNQNLINENNLLKNTIKNLKNEYENLLKITKSIENEKKLQFNSYQILEQENLTIKNNLFNLIKISNENIENICNWINNYFPFNFDDKIQLPNIKILDENNNINLNKIKETILNVKNKINFDYSNFNNENVNFKKEIDLLKEDNSKLFKILNSIINNFLLETKAKNLFEIPNYKIDSNNFLIIFDDLLKRLFDYVTNLKNLKNEDLINDLKKENFNLNNEILNCHKMLKNKEEQNEKIKNLQKENFNYINQIKLMNNLQNDLKNKENLINKLQNNINLLNEENEKNKKFQIDNNNLIKDNVILIKENNKLKKDLDFLINNNKL